MKYQYKNAIKGRARALEVACAHCKTPIMIYQKRGKGGLIKLQFFRIIESEVDIADPPSALTCLNCGQELAKLGDNKGEPTYWVTRGQVHTRWLRNYRMGQV